MSTGAIGFRALACAFLLATSMWASEASAMRLATFEFEGTVNSNLSVPHTIFGTFTIDLEAAYSEPNGNYPDGIVEFTVAYNSGQGIATGDYEPGGIFGRSPILLLGPRQGIAINSSDSGEQLTISAPLSGEPGFIYQSGRPFLSISDTFLEINGFEMIAFGASGETGLTIERILALANQGMRFELFGTTSEQGTVTTIAVPTPDFFIPFEPNPNEFIAEGTIDSVTLVSQVPLPAAAWLMLSALAGLAGLRVWPRLRSA